MGAVRGRWWRRLLVVVVAAAVTVPAGCAGDRRGQREPSHRTPTATQHRIRTATRDPSMRPASPRPPTPHPPRRVGTPHPHTAGPNRTAPSSPVADPAQVVTAYVRAINERNYARAWWLLGSGRPPGQGYQQFVSGFAGTDHDRLTIVSTSGGTVSVRLLAYQTDGTRQVYTGTYTVRGGRIAGADIRPVSTPGGCGAPANPYGYTFCRTGRLIQDPPAGFCDHFDCIPSFGNGTGYVVQCQDREFSGSGGRPGACSYHGGPGRILYAP